MVTAVPGSQRRSTVTQEPALPAVHEGVIVTAFVAASDSSEVRFGHSSSQARTSVTEYCASCAPYLYSLDDSCRGAE